MNNLTHVIPAVTPFDQLVAVTTAPSWRANFLVYRQNIFPSMKNEFANYSTGYSFTTDYKNNVWNDVFSVRMKLADANSLCGVHVSQSMYALDPPGNKNNATVSPFLTRTGPLEINNSTLSELRFGDVGGVLQNAKFSYTKGSSVDGAATTTILTSSIYNHITTIPGQDLSSFSAAGTITIGSEQITYSSTSSNDFTGVTRGANGTVPQYHASGTAIFQADGGSARVRRMRSLSPGPLGWAKHMIGSPNSVTRIGAQEIPETGSLTGSFDLNEQIEIYSGEADWQSDTPTKAGVVVYDSKTKSAKFEVSASYPWYETYNDYWQDLKLLAKGYSVLPSFRISDHVEEYLNYGANNKGTDTFSFAGVTSDINSSNSTFYKDYTNSDFLKGFLKVSQKTLLNAVELRLTCDAAIAWRPQPSFYPAQRAAEMVSQFSKSYGNSIRGVFQNAVMTGSTLFEENGGCLRPMFEALYSPGILFNTMKAGIACNYPIIPDDTQISGTWFGERIGDTYSDNWALVPNNVNTTLIPVKLPAKANIQHKGFLEKVRFSNSLSKLSLSLLVI